MNKKLWMLMAVGGVTLSLVFWIVLTKPFTFLKPVPVGGQDLEVLTYDPQGPDMPISTEGITVMFNQPMVPLTVLQEGKKKEIPLKISPSIEGEFNWLGTQAFIFKPKTPFQAATTYTVDLDSKITSLDGHSLKEPLHWEFTTVLPHLVSWYPTNNQILLPQKAEIIATFNLEMNRKSVEENLDIQSGGKSVDAKKEFVWLDNDHQVKITFKDELPWDTKFNVILKSGVQSIYGPLPSTKEAKTTFQTPPKDVVLEKVFAPQYDPNTNEPIEVPVQESKENKLSAGDNVCFHFNQAIVKKTFEKSLQVRAPKALSSIKITPYFYYNLYSPLYITNEHNESTQIDGYQEACVATLDEYDTSYEIEFNLKNIETPAGAKGTDAKKSFSVKTGNALPTLNTHLTKNILSYKGPMKLSFSATNIQNIHYRLYALDPSYYTESIKGEDLIDYESENNEGESPEIELSTNQSIPPLKIPVIKNAGEGLVIDTISYPSKYEGDIPIPTSKDVKNKAVPFSIDLKETAQGLVTPGIYLMEITGHSAIPGKEPTSSKIAVIQVTNVGLALKREVDHAFVWATELETGSPISGLPVKITFHTYDGTLKSTIESTTQEAGVAIAKLSDLERDYRIEYACVQATHPDYASYSCDKFHSLTHYKYPLASSKNYFAYLYTDRPIYKPGQKIYYSLFLREVKEGRYFMTEDHPPCKLSLTDSSGTKLFEDTQCSLTAGGFLSGEFQLPNDDNLSRGSYELTLRVQDKQSFTRTLLVTSYRKPSFKVALIPEKPSFISGEKLRAGLEGSYYFGAPLKKAPVRWSLMTATYLFKPKEYPLFSFFDPELLYQKNTTEDGEYSSADPEYLAETDYDFMPPSNEAYENESDYKTVDPTAPSKEPITSFTSHLLKDEKGKVPENKEVLKDDGKATLEYPLSLTKFATSQVFTLEAKVQDSSHEEVSTSEDMVIHKASYYAGLKSDKYFYPEKEKATVHIVTLAPDEKAAPKKKYTLDVISRDYQTIEKRNAQGYWEIQYENKDTVLQTLSGSTDTEGKSHESFDLPKGGTYRLLLKSKDEKGNEIQASTEIYASGQNYVPWKVNEPQTIELVPDKESYHVGETAKVLIKSLVPVTKALLTLERGRVLDYKLIDLPGSNASYIEIPVNEGLIPNVYVSLLAHVGRKANQPPLLFHGNTELKIEPEKKKLNLAVTLDHPSADAQTLSTYKPGETVTVRIDSKDADGLPKKSRLMVTVADKSVLDLVGYQTPDLLNTLYYRRAHKVTASSSLLSLKAGDGGSGTNRRKNFKDTAAFIGQLETDAQGGASFSFVLPDDTTTWAIEALAITDSKTYSSFEKEKTPAYGSALSLTDGTFVGSVRKEFISTLPIVLKAYLPRFAAYGDNFTGSLQLINRTTTALKGSIKVHLDGPASLEKDKDVKNIEKPFSLDVAGQIKIDLPVQISKNIPLTNTEKITVFVDAINDASTPLDSISLNIPVKDRAQAEVVATSGTVDTNHKEEIQLTDDVIKDRGGLNIELKSSLALSIAPVLKRLMDFPYNCAEQKSSSLIAQLMAYDLSGKLGEKYFDTLAPLNSDEIKSAKSFDEKKQKLHTKIKKNIDDLTSNYFSPYGGISYWPQGTYSDLPTSVQVLWSFYMAKKLGFNVPPESVNQLRNYLVKILNKPDLKVHTDLYNKDTKTVVGELDNRKDPDLRAFLYWVLSQDSEAPVLIDETNEDLIKDPAPLSVTGLSYLSLALSNKKSAMVEPIIHRIESLAQQKPRSLEWASSSFFAGTTIKNSALATLALLEVNPEHPMIPKSLESLLNKTRSSAWTSTQEDLYQGYLSYRLFEAKKEFETNFTATVKKDQNLLTEQKFQAGNLLEVKSASFPLSALNKEKSEISFEKQGSGTLYYDMLLKYYLPVDKIQPVEDYIIISRDYYDLDDVKEEKPLKKFVVGKTYKVHLTLMTADDLSYVLIEDLLPAGFEPIDMNLKTSSRTAQLEADETDDESEEDSNSYFNVYDDVLPVELFSSDYEFAHTEVRDDAMIFSDNDIPAGTYHVRYPVRASFPGTYLNSGATAFEFYEPEVFGRSMARIIIIEEGK